MRGSLFQVHTACKESLVTKCPLGLCKVSVIPPTALNSIDSDGGYHALALPPCVLLPLSGVDVVGRRAGPASGESAPVQRW